jgi:hypothetical protein
MISGIIIQILYVIIIWLLPNGLLVYVSFGNFYGIWFNLIFKYCYFNHKYQIKLCCFPFKINTKIYPFIFLLFLMAVAF